MCRIDLPLRRLQAVCSNLEVGQSVRSVAAIQCCGSLRLGVVSCIALDWSRRGLCFFSDGLVGAQSRMRGAPRES